MDESKWPCCEYFPICFNENSPVLLRNLSDGTFAKSMKYHLYGWYNLSSTICQPQGVQETKQ